VKIYTKTGDQGQTSLYGGKRVQKHDLRIESYGTLDELNSYIGLIRDLLINSDQDTLLKQIQITLFDIGSHLAADPEKTKLKMPQFQDDLIQNLENAIDFMNEVIPPLKSFILPGGHATVSHIHISRTICRKAERRISMLAQNEEIHSIINPYINRLSDYLFVLARYIAKQNNIEENLWNPTDKS